jgi:colicin import membrane protein
MQAARAFAAVVFTAAATLMMFASPQSVEAAQAGEAVRERAEDLARAASQRFSEVLKGEPQGQERGRPPGGSEFWGNQWFQRSTQDYNSVVRRLSQATGSVPAPSPPTQNAPPVKADPQATGAPDWLTWSSERFQEIMRKLAEGAAPPHAQPPEAANKASPEEAAAQSKAQQALDGAVKPGPAAPVGLPATAKPPPQSPPGGEERKITETRRAEAAKREAEVKRTEEVLKADQQKKEANAAAEAAKKSAAARRAAEVKGDEEVRKAEAVRKADEAKKAQEARRASEAAKTAEEARRHAEAKAAEAARKAAETAAKQAAQVDAEKMAQVRKAERAKRLAEAKKAGEEARQRGAEAKRLADQRAKDAAERRSAEAAAKMATKDVGQGLIAQGPSPERSKGAVGKARKTAERSNDAGAPTRAAGSKTPAAGRRARAGPRRSRVARRSRSCERAGTAVELPGWYVVKEGDTLWSIAERHYGAGRRYKRIYAANRRRIRSAHWIEPCQRVYLPRPLRRK